LSASFCDELTIATWLMRTKSAVRSSGLPGNTRRAVHRKLAVLEHVGGSGLMLMLMLMPSKVGLKSAIVDSSEDLEVRRLLWQSGQSIEDVLPG
jgi:hypothetical protein